MCGKKTTFEFFKTYLEHMIIIPNCYDVIIASGNIEEG